MIPGPLRFLGSLIPRPDPVEVDHEVDEAHLEGLPDDFTVLDTPGHTPGHISYLLDRSGGVLLVGDAAVAKDGSVVKGFMNRTTRPFRSSIAHIGEQDFDVAVFGHSGPLVGEASAAFARYAATL
jgi:glyoxylase-like metal-dependent hydrolase (beta-lactamase superfamily II)